MISIPRDLVDVPLPDGRRFRGKINSLVSYARHHPRQFPGSNGKGFDVLMDALGTLLQQPITYYAKVDLGGFVRVVDTLGGVNVNVARGFCDAKYSEYGYERGFSITAGRHHLNGQQALAYARVRKTRRRERLHAGGSPAGGRFRDPRRDRQGRLPQRPDSGC